LVLFKQATSTYNAHKYTMSDPEITNNSKYHKILKQIANS